MLDKKNGHQFLFQEIFPPFFFLLSALFLTFTFAREAFTKTLIKQLIVELKTAQKAVK